MVVAERAKAGRPRPSGIPEGQEQGEAVGGGDKIQVGGKLLDPNFRLPDACLNSPSSFLSKGVLF